MEQPPKKKRRENPSRKWRDIETLKMLQYISVHAKTFEKPTSRLYYNQMIREIKIDATWDLIKWKIRHLRLKFFKALDYKNSADHANDNSVQDKVLNMCPHFDLLATIFGDKYLQSKNLAVSQPNDSNPESIVKTENYVEMETERSFYELTYDEDVTNNTNNGNYDQDDNNEGDYVDGDSDDISTLQEQNSVTAETTTNNNKVDNSPLDPLVTTTNTTHADRSISSSSIFLNSDVCLSNLSESERAKYFENMFDLEKRKIVMEEFKIRRDLEINEIKLKHDFEIRKLEIEKDERVAKYEIEMRYKYKKHSESDI